MMLLCYAIFLSGAYITLIDIICNRLVLSTIIKKDRVKLAVLKIMILVLEMFTC